jgi:hypothetical protein
LRFSEKCWPSNGHRTPLEKIDYHFRWNADYIPTILQPGTVVVTTIREPEATFRSVYNYYYFDKGDKDQKCSDVACWKQPFKKMLGNREKVPIEEFLDLLPKIFDEKIGQNFRAKNYQSFEMGLDHLNNDEEYISTELERLDTQFDLGNGF